MILLSLWSLHSLKGETGRLRVERMEEYLLEEYLQRVHTDNHRQVELADIPSVGECLLYVEVKIFFSVVARRLVSYLKANGLIDISGYFRIFLIFGTYCSMIWHQMQASRTEGRDPVCYFWTLLKPLDWCHIVYCRGHSVTFRSLRRFQH